MSSNSKCTTRSFAGTAHALRAEIYRAAMEDSSFRAQLMADAKQAVEERLGPVSHTVRVYAERPREFALLIPNGTPDVIHDAEQREAIFRASDAPGPTRGQLEAMLVKKALASPEYRRELIDNSKAVLDCELQKFGGSIPPDVHVCVLAEQESECLVILPASFVPGRLNLTAAELNAAGTAAIPVAWIVSATATPIGQQVVGGTVSSVVGAIVGNQIAVIGTEPRSSMDAAADENSDDFGNSQ